MQIKRHQNVTCMEKRTAEAKEMMMRDKKGVH